MSFQLLQNDSNHYGVNATADNNKQLIDILICCNATPSPLLVLITHHFLHTHTYIYIYTVHTCMSEQKKIFYDPEYIYATFLKVSFHPVNSPVHYTKPSVHARMHVSLAASVSCIHTVLTAARI